MTHALDVNERLAQLDESRPTVAPVSRAKATTDRFPTFAITFGVAFAILYTVLSG